MIRKLRRRLVLAFMLSLLAVLTVLLTLAGAVTYHGMVDRADLTLAILAENDGEFPQPFMPDQPGIAGGMDMSPELPYESRFFSVVLGEDGTVFLVNVGNIASVNLFSAKEYAQEVVERGRQRGFADQFRYVVYQDGEVVHTIFLDCGRQLELLRVFFFTGAGVAVLGMLCVLVLLTLSSRRIVRPFVENEEKQKRFITDAGHELKTPLTIINADADLLEMDLGESQWLEDIRSQTDRLAGLTGKLIRLSRMEEGDRGQMALFSLTQVVAEEVQAFQAVARSQGRVLESRLTPELSLWGDRKEIQELVSILLDNGVKYANPGGRIMVSLERRKREILLRVGNTVESISQETVDHLFDRFYRGDASRNSQTAGYGLGLSIAAAIVAAHRGRIAAAAKGAGYFEITVTFPVPVSRALRE